MHSFHYHQNELYCEDLPLSRLAEEHSTPLFVYSGETLRNNYQSLDSAFHDLEHEVAYAVKANSNLSVLKLLAEEGCGFDIVSGGELHRVLKAGGDPHKCTFAGVGKTRSEIEAALQADIFSINVESLAEAEFISQVASDLGKPAPIAFRINPNVDAKTHKYISTGKSENKFGIDFDQIPEAYQWASKLPNIHLRGLQMHIGSQLTSTSPFQEAVAKVAPLVEQLRDTYNLEFFSIGGGIGIVYEEALASGASEWWENHPDRPITPADYASAIKPLLKPLGLKIFLEPGRFIAGNAGVLLTRCLYEKKGSEKTFKIVDSGMHHLLRPALYEGHHEIVPLKQNQAHSEKIDVVGPICETGDFFCQNRDVASFEQGDIIALMSAGAYGLAMASTYNTHPLPPEVLVDRSKAHLVRRRQTYEEILAQEILV